MQWLLNGQMLEFNHHQPHMHNLQMLKHRCTSRRVKGLAKLCLLTKFLFPLQLRSHEEELTTVFRGPSNR
jgi:hypothetical protein